MKNNFSKTAHASGAWNSLTVVIMHHHSIRSQFNAKRYPFRETFATPTNPQREMNRAQSTSMDAKGGLFTDKLPRTMIMMAEVRGNTALLTGPRRISMCSSPIVIGARIRCTPTLGSVIPIYSAKGALELALTYLLRSRSMHLIECPVMPPAVPHLKQHRLACLPPATNPQDGDG